MLAAALWMPAAEPDLPLLAPRVPLASSPTSYADVARHLETGGSFYLYVNPASWLEGLSGSIREWEPLVLGLPGMNPEQQSRVKEVFSMVCRMVQHSGVESVRGIGMSATELAPGLHHTRAIVQLKKGATPGYASAVFGGNPHPLEGLDLLPADTALAWFNDLSLAALWGIVRTEIGQADIPEASRWLARFPVQFERRTMVNLDRLLASLGSEAGIVMTLNPERKVALPIPRPPGVEIPEPALALVIAVKDDTVFDRMEIELKKNPNLIVKDEGGLRMRVMEVPAPLPMPVRFTLARFENYLVIATSGALVETMAAVRQGRRPGLQATAEFRRLAPGIPARGNAFSFLSERFSAAIQDVQRQVLKGMGSQGEGAGPQAVATMPAKLIERFFAMQAPAQSLGVSARIPDGWLMVNNGNQEPAKALVASTLVPPVAIMAGMTLPALTAARGRAQSIACVNNLKQVGLGAKIWAIDHDDTLPSRFDQMKEEISLPRILVCPIDPRPRPESMSWSDFDTNLISYILVSPGVKDSADPDTVFARCPYHGHEVRVDGSVHQGPQR